MAKYVVVDATDLINLFNASGGDAAKAFELLSILQQPGSTIVVTDTIRLEVASNVSYPQDALISQWLDALSRLQNDPSTNSPVLLEPVTGLAPGDNRGEDSIRVWITEPERFETNFDPSIDTLTIITDDAAAFTDFKALQVGDVITTQNLLTDAVFRGELTYADALDAYRNAFPDGNVPLADIADARLPDIFKSGSGDISVPITNAEGEAVGRITFDPESALNGSDRAIIVEAVASEGNFSERLSLSADRSITVDRANGIISTDLNISRPNATDLSQSTLRATVDVDGKLSISLDGKVFADRVPDSSLSIAADGETRISIYGSDLRISPDGTGSLNGTDLSSRALESLWRAGSYSDGPLATLLNSQATSLGLGLAGFGVLAVGGMLASERISQAFENGPQAGFSQLRTEMYGLVGIPLAASLLFLFIPPALGALLMVGAIGLAGYELFNNYGPFKNWWANLSLGGTLDRLVPFSKFFPNPFRLADPLVIDLPGTGIDLTSISTSNAHFDFIGNGWKEGKALAKRSIHKCLNQIRCEN